MTRRRTPLQVLMRSVACESCSDGTIRVMPHWRERPGVITRMYAARHLSKLVNRHLGQR